MGVATFLDRDVCVCASSQTPCMAGDLTHLACKVHCWCRTKSHDADSAPSVTCDIYDEAEQDTSQSPAQGPSSADAGALPYSRPTTVNEHGKPDPTGLPTSAGLPATTLEGGGIHHASGSPR